MLKCCCVFFFFMQKPHRLLPTNLYVILYNFKARHPDELDLKAGYKVNLYLYKIHTYMYTIHHQLHIFEIKIKFYVNDTLTLIFHDTAYILLK